MDFLPRYAAFLAITCIVELAIVKAMTHRRAPRPGVLEILAFNLFTHPLAMLAIMEDIPFLTTEIGVVIIEAILYRTVCRLSWGWAASVSLVANGVTAYLSIFIP